MPINKTSLNELLQGGQQEASNLSAQQRQQMQGQQASNLEAQKAAQQQAAQEAALQRVQQFMPKDKQGNPVLPEGTGISVTPEGAAISRGLNQRALQMQMEKGDASARSNAQKLYSQGLTKLQPVAQAASEGLDMINDPQNPGSLGQARTLMLKSMGMNRYNEQEAKAVLPPSLYSIVSAMFNQAGSDTNPLNPAQRQAINQFFKTQINNADTQHKMLKQNALNAYSSSPFANQGGLQALSNMGAPMDDFIGKASSKYKDLPVTQGPNLTSAPNPGPLDKLKAFFGMGGSTPQQSAAPQMPSMDAIQQEIMRRRSGK